jgi:hypothetical protein
MAPILLAAWCTRPIRSSSPLERDGVAGLDAELELPERADWSTWRLSSIPWHASMNAILSGVRPATSSR